MTDDELAAIVGRAKLTIVKSETQPPSFCDGMPHLDRPQNKHLKPVKPGEVRNPAGRPKGSRNKLSDAFVQVLADDFEAHGKGVVEKVCMERPQDYLKIVASVMPKLMEVDDVGPPRRAADLSDDELAAIVAGAKLTVV